MSHSLFSDDAKAQLAALKKQLETQSKNNTVETSKPDLPVNLPSKKTIEKQVAQHKRQASQEKTFAERMTGQATELSHDDLPDDKQLEDTLLFQHAMQGVTPLAIKNTITPDRLTSKKQQQSTTTLAKRAAAEGEQDATSGLAISDMQAMLNPVAAEAYLMYKQPTVQHHVFSQLKEGNLRWYDAVDIHGSTIEEARDAVLKIIKITQENAHTVLKIVHGKSASLTKPQEQQAILKTCVNGWLRQHPDVLAFCSATPKDGGTGAVVVLIKRSDKAK